VPERLFLTNGRDTKDGLQEVSLAGQLLAILLSEKSGIAVADNTAAVENLDKFAAQFTGPAERHP
jgi:hypothetical protein